MKHSVSHDLGRDRAKQVAQKALEHYKSKYPKYAPGGEWTTPYSANVRFAVAGAKFEGRLKIMDNRIEMELDVPFLFRPFRNKALQVVEADIRKWIAKAKSGRK
jgi:hypothetical protein